MIKHIKKLKYFLNYFISKKVSSEIFVFNIEIDINKINNFLELKNTLDRKNFIWDGDWDYKKINISKYRNYSASYNSIFQIYLENKNFKECEEYRIKTDLILKGKKTGRANNMFELDNYFKSLETLKNNLNKYGYKNQIELKNDDKKNDEIGVVINRHGEIIKLEDKFGGTHRFALCKILGISKITVSIKAIHKSLIKEELIDKIAIQNDKSQMEMLVKKAIDTNYN